MTGIYEGLQKAIDEKDVLEGYAVIATLLGEDRWLTELQTPFLTDYADKNFKNLGIDFWVKDDNETEFPRKEEWNKDLWNLICVRLDRNFSKKKFDFIIKIMKHLRETGHPEFQADEASTQSQTKKTANSTGCKSQKNNSQAISANYANEYEFNNENKKSENKAKRRNKKTSKKGFNKDDYILTGAGAVIGSILGAIVGRPITGGIIGAGIVGGKLFFKKNK